MKKSDTRSFIYTISDASDITIISERISPGLISELIKTGLNCKVITSLKSATIICIFKRLAGYSDSQLTISYTNENLYNRCIIKPSASGKAYVIEIPNNANITNSPSASIHSLGTVPYNSDDSDASSFVLNIGMDDVYEIINNSPEVSIPLYIVDKETHTKKTPDASGINWGGQSGNTRNSGPIEAYIPINKPTILSSSFFVPPTGITSPGCETKSVYVDLIWDDGTIMPAFMAGKGPAINELIYPNKLTSADGGGAQLGGYFRKRLNVAERSLITYRDFSKYGRDNIRLVYLSENVYYVDFSVK